jgi:energy-coupling factor transporter transmembrane protein EcfT
MEIHHSKKLPFRLEDWLRTFIFIGLTIAAIASLRSDGIVSIGTVFLLVVIFVGILPLYLRWKRLQPLKYLITNERLLIVNGTHNIIERSFDFVDFPEINFHENAYNSGFIIIGEVQPTIGLMGLFGTRVGVNLADHEIVLENISDVRKVYDFIKAKIENAQIKE